ncbi:hypothetical protein [Streptomyces diastatochromogenes]|uniref:Uncharacterized protein n=1 Tax=Streptomyces diastatochromogenes TaxID=42236 RepID=A0A233S9V1_STRDA|nr:hypothetical protein [Streptomyces diastatochromogenes]MCZ0990892.1 hypothetical protein [Streptomyces diastatochromogenes]OXY92456.1 hypothetical protein BEK98_27210 [Streptomyces diastatochromogenes]
MAAGLACRLGRFLGQVLGSGALLTTAGDGLVPRLPGVESVVPAGGIVGATVMPHVIDLDVPVRVRVLRKADVTITEGAVLGFPSCSCGTHEPMCA